MIRFLLGLTLMPTSALTLAAAVRSVGSLAWRAQEAAPFIAGFALSAAFWLISRAAQPRGGPAAWFSALGARAYVFGHELTHALAAWSVGARVLDFHVGETGGHVDLSESNAYVALAPYCVPIYTLAVIAGYRVLLWLRPDCGGQSVFLALIGAALSFHALKTFECLWDRRQPDLKAGGGTVFSLACIGLANGLFILVLAKMLFPREIGLATQLRMVAGSSRAFWLGLWTRLKPAAVVCMAKLRGL